MCQLPFMGFPLLDNCIPLGPSELLGQQATLMQAMLSSELPFHPVLHSLQQKAGLRDREGEEINVVNPCAILNLAFF